MNYVPVVLGNQTNGIAGTRDNIVTDPKVSKEDAEEKPTKMDEIRASDKDRKDDQVTRSEFERLLQQEKQTVHLNNTNSINTVSTPIFSFQKCIYTPMDDTRIFGNAYDDEDVGVDANLNNLETTMNMDVKSAFLYGTIEEEVYVCQPPGFEDPQFPDKVYKVYVDDIIFGSTKKSLCDEFEGLMHKRFQMSSMGELTFFLGLQVQQKKDGIFISQDKYVADILKKFDFATVKTASTPMEPNKALIKDEEADSVDVHLYRSMIGSLMYLIASRPDIMFAVCACARDSPFDLEAFSDSDYAGASLDRKSTTGGCQFLGKRLISWQCKKQTIVANSTTKAEYVAAANCCGQVLWIQNQMLDYGFNFMNTKIYIDNESTICIVKNPVFHSKTKHIEIRHHFIRDSYEKRLIQVIKIHTDHNVADLLTKAFDVSRFNFLVASIGLELKDKKELAIPGQTTIGKEFSNPLMAGSLPKL
ncbi:putative ribonuclease H-like domain-containing protein [Tanacetum coccineum]